MSVSLENNVVAILGAGGGIVGTGFVVGERLILTCAHVIEKAGSGPGGPVNLRWHIKTDETQTATVDRWDAPNDLAVLRLSADPPPGIVPVRLGDSSDAAGKAFHAFGYPDLGTDGSPADGTVTGSTRGKDGQALLMLKSSQLARGFSGGPVWVGDEVIGVVTAVYHTDKTLKNFDTAWAIPVEVARQLCPELNTPAPGLWPLGHSYATAPNFTGRLMERGQLSDWLTHGPTVLVIEAHGGFGKSALTWHWLTNDVDRTRWPRAVWWNFYDTREFDSFLQDTLTHLGVEVQGIGSRLLVDRLVEQLARPGTLLILDGFERALRAYSGMNAAYQGDEPQPPPQPRLRAVPRKDAGQGRESGSPLPNAVLSRSGEGSGVGAERDSLSPLADQFLRAIASRNLGGRVLLTTRLRPRALEGHDQRLLQYAKEIKLTALSLPDAVEFLHAEGVKGTRAELEVVCKTYGNYPLALRLLAGLIANDLHKPGDIAVAGRLDVSGDLIQRQHHVLEQAYNLLIPPRRKLLNWLACFRNPMAYEAIQAIADPSPQPHLPPLGGSLTGKGASDSPPRFGEGPGVGSLDAHLRDLIARGFLHHDRAASRYDLHPIVRRYSYDRLTDKTAAHTRLRAYFVVIEVPEKFKTLDELTPLIELYHHTVRAGQYDEAFTLFRDRISSATYYQFGAYQLQIELLRSLFPDGEDKPSRLNDESAQAWTLNGLANSYSLNGQPRRAVPLFEGYVAISEKRGDKTNLAIGLGNVADDQLHIGALRAAEANLRRSIGLCREIEDKYQEAVGHKELGRVLAYQGKWEDAEQELVAALAIDEKQKNVQAQCLIWAYRALRALLMRNGVEALASAHRALELADETANDPRFVYPVRDYVRAHWLLGAAHRANGNLAEAEHHLIESLTRCRGINLVESEADILIDLARLRIAAPRNEPEEAEQLAREALEITERCGYVLRGADAHLVLAKLALSRGDKAQARAHAQAARQLATCDSEPYVYRVAYDEAGALLNQIGRG